MYTFYFLFMMNILVTEHKNELFLFNYLLTTSLLQNDKALKCHGLEKRVLLRTVLSANTSLQYCYY